MADAVVPYPVDGLVGPFCRSTRERLGVGVAGGGVDREQDEAFCCRRGPPGVRIDLGRRCSVAQPQFT